MHREQIFSTKVSGKPRSGRLLVKVAFPTSLAFALSKVSGCTNNRDAQSPSSFRVLGNSDAGPGVLQRTVPYQNPWGVSHPPKPRLLDKDSHTGSAKDAKEEGERGGVRRGPNARGAICPTETQKKGCSGTSGARVV